MTIVGTRPELIKLSLVIPAMDQAFHHILVHSGQNYDFELNEIFFRDLNIRKPDHFLECAQPTALQTIAEVLIKCEAILLKESPEAVLIYGDTNSCYAALAAKKLRIPLFHMEAGNRCFDERVPEEINRRVIDHVSDINMPLTEHARRYLIKEGLPPDRVIKTGSCMPEILNHFKQKIADSKALEKNQLKPKDYFLISCHREENVDSSEKLKSLILTLSRLANDFKKDIIFSVHPRTQKRLDTHHPDWNQQGQVKALKPLGFFDYVHLQQDAFCVLSDSGTLMEECDILGFPAVHCRDAFERPEGMEVGTLIVSPLEPTKISQAVRIVTSTPRPTPTMPQVADYQLTAVSRTVVRIIQTYTPMINSQVWHK